MELFSEKVKIFMEITGIICEYNPLHLGHRKQLAHVRAGNPNGGIACIMSGNFVQRGQPAIFDKLLRAKAAILSGADLVLELPVTAALSSAEGFASEGVRMLSGFCDRLCFGAESDNVDALLQTAQALLSADFTNQLRVELDKGLSFPVARQAALEAMGHRGELLTQPNNILAVEYCKAIIAQGSSMQPMPILRQGSYHNELPDAQNPSATAVRLLLETGGSWQTYVPEEASAIFSGAAVHTLQNGEKAMLARLRTMTDAEFEALPYGSEGLWRKLMHASRQQNTLEDILTATKSKRYTRTRLDRMVMCAFLGLTKEDLSSPAPYARVLALNDNGREILKKARDTGHYPNIGERLDHPYQTIETRCGALYGLFTDTPEAPSLESQYRVYYTP